MHVVKLITLISCKSGKFLNLLSIKYKLVVITLGSKRRIDSLKSKLLQHLSSTMQLYRMKDVVNLLLLE